MSSFFQVVRELEVRSPGKAPLGALGPIANEPVVFVGNPVLSFSATSVGSIAANEAPDAPTRVTINFLSLTGAGSPLPSTFHEWSLEREHGDGGDPLRALLDTVQHRLVSLLYRSYHASVRSTSHKEATAGLCRNALSLLGFDPTAIEAESVIPRGEDTREESVLPGLNTLIRLSRFLMAGRGTAQGLALALGEEFGAFKPAVLELQPVRVPIPENCRFTLATSGCTLGIQTVLGRTLLDLSAKVVIAFNEVDFESYISLLPGGQLWRRARQILSVFVDSAHEVDLEVRLRSESLPDCVTQCGRSARVGVSFWLRGEPRRPHVIRIHLSP